MIPVVTVEQMGEMDQRAVRDLGIPDVVLMENAGRSTFEHLLAFMEEEEVFNIAVLRERATTAVTPSWLPACSCRTASHQICSSPPRRKNTGAAPPSIYRFCSTTG